AYTIRLRVGDFSAAPLLHDESTFTFTKSASTRGEGGAAGATTMTPADWGADARILDAPAVHAAVVGEAPALATFPNPFREGATVRFTLPEEASVRVAVCDVL